MLLSTTLEATTSATPVVVESGQFDQIGTLLAVSCAFLAIAVFCLGGILIMIMHGGR